MAVSEGCEGLVDGVQLHHLNKRLGAVCPIVVKLEAFSPVSVGAADKAWIMCLMPVTHMNAHQQRN